MDEQDNNLQVDLNDAKKQVEKACKRMALLHLSYAKTIINELGKEKGEKLVLKAIKDYGMRIGRGVKEEVKKQGLTNEIGNYKEDLPEYGMH